jgi:hypothetical protein
MASCPLVRLPACPLAHPTSTTSLSAWSELAQKAWHGAAGKGDGRPVEPPRRRMVGLFGSRSWEGALRHANESARIDFAISDVLDDDMHGHPLQHDTNWVEGGWAAERARRSTLERNGHFSLCLHTCAAIPVSLDRHSVTNCLGFGFDPRSSRISKYFWPFPRHRTHQ